MADVKAIFGYACDAEVARFTGWEPARSIEDTEGFLQGVLARYRAGRAAPWGVVHVADQRLIGTCGFSSFNPLDRSGALGYAFSRAYWRQGLATEAVKEVIQFGFHALGLYRIWATCLAENIGSWRVMEKAGMRYQNTLRGLPVKGHPRDIHTYAVFRQEWLARQGHS
jgi:ribosomal-protein-alanine N-acetyltransferase